MHGLLFLATLLLSPAANSPAASGDDWPRFHGLHGNGTSHETGLIHEWGEQGPGVLWTVEVGPGFGGAAVRDDEVYLLDRAMSEADVMRCFELATGEEKWNQRIEAEGRLPFPGSRSVPTVEEEYVYGMGGFGHVICCSRETGEIEWTVNVVDEFDGDLPMFGYAISPVVWEDLVIVAPLGAEVGLVALDRFMGEEVWRTESVGSTQGSPMLVERDGVPQVMMLSAPPRARGGGGRGPGGGGFPGGLGRGGRGQDGGAGGDGQDGGAARGRDGRPRQDARPGGDGARRGPPGEGGGGFEMPRNGILVAIEVESGEELWRTEPGTSNTIVMPLLLDQDQMLLTGDENLLLTRKSTEDSVSFEKVFASAGGSELHLPMVHEDHFYMVSGGGSGGGRGARSGRGATGRLICLSRDGEEKWRSGEDSTYGTGNVLLADGHLYIHDGYTGCLRVVEASPDGYAVKAEAQLFDEGRGDRQMWAPMALAHGRLLLRSQDTLHCVDLRASN